MIDEELRAYFVSANEFVKDLKDKPEKRMESVYVNDEVVFLKQDEKNTKLWNFGYGRVMSVENTEGTQKSVCKIDCVKNIFLKSPSYPFNVYVEPQHILRNYTADKRKLEKAKEQNESS